MFGSVSLCIIFFVYLLRYNNAQIQWKAQNAYEVEIQHTIVESFNKSVIKSAMVKSFKLNRRQIAFNISLHFLSTVDNNDNAHVKIDAFKKMGQEFRLQIFEMDLLFCDLVSNHFYKTVNLHYADGSPVTQCPVRSGEVVAYNQIIDGTSFPPNIPAGLYKVQLHFSFNKDTPFLSIVANLEVIYKKKN